MKIGRRAFLGLSALGLGGLAMGRNAEEDERRMPKFKPDSAPLVLSTWNHGLAANEGAWSILGNGGSALDAVEKGVMVTESDPENRSVGLGGLPDRDGRTTLDASIMDHRGRCGSVACLEHIEHPISVARKVMEDTPHVMLVGEGAYRFAIEKGFQHRDYLTEKSREEVKRSYEEWLKTSEYKPIINRENHDTIGMVALDSQGNLSGACTTSGLAYKRHGRVGDSPIIGAGLYVDNEVGAATATGLGEAVIRVCGSHLVVELMRQGYTPGKACEIAVKRLIQKHESVKDLQVGFLAINKAGEYGGFAIYEGFNFALKSRNETRLVDTAFVHKW